MPTHVVSVSRQRVNGQGGIAVALTIGTEAGESITTLVRHFPIESPSDPSEEVLARGRALEEAHDLFTALRLSPVNEVLFASDSDFTLKWIKQTYGFDAVAQVPPAVDVYFDSQVIR